MDAFSETMKHMNAAIDAAAAPEQGHCWECAHYLNGWCRVDYPGPEREVDGDGTCPKWEAF